MSHYYNEIDKFCCAVLRTQIEKGNLQHGTVDQRDIREVRGEELRGYRHIELFAGIAGFGRGFYEAGFPDGISVCTFGSPCTDLSVAGKRAGLAGSKSGLFWEAIRIMGEVRPSWAVFENVPGLLSSKRGGDFVQILRGLGDIGLFPSIAWAVLDSRWFGVAQRRRRVFAVCGPRIGDAEKVLSLAESCRGDLAPSPQPRAEVARALANGSVSSGYRFDPNGEELVASSLSASAGHHGHSSPRGDGSDNLVCDAITASGGKRNMGDVGDGLVAYNVHSANSCVKDRHAYEAEQIRCLDTSGGFASSQGGTVVASTLSSCTEGFRTEPGEHLAYCLPSVHRGVGNGHNANFVSDVAYALRRDPGGIGQGHNTNFVETGAVRRLVRRLTPTECETLQNFPKGWTIPSHDHWKYKDDPEWPLLPEGMDSPRYRSLGNAVSVSVAKWIAERIAEVEKGRK